MFSAWTFFLSCGAASLALTGAAPVVRVPRGRSFLASAWRAARSGSSAQWWLSRKDEANAAFGEDPALASVPPEVASVPPEPAVPEAPKALPPKFPVMSQEECELFQEGFLVSPGAKCQHVIFAENVDGCTCTINLPASINPQATAGNLYNPFLPEIPPDPSVPLPQAMPTVPPPSNPLQPYLAPMMPPECPFITACGDPESFDCVGYNSWGFTEAGMSGYTPAAASLNMMSCSYLMKPYSEFKIPTRMKALWRLNAKQMKVFKRMNEPFLMKCVGQNVASASQLSWCNDKVNRMKFSCDKTWEDVAKATAKACEAAPAPEGFATESTLADLCPTICGWKKGVVKWPPLSSSEEKAESAEDK